MSQSAFEDTKPDEYADVAPEAGLESYDDQSTGQLPDPDGTSDGAPDGTPDVALGEEDTDEAASSVGGESRKRSGSANRALIRRVANKAEEVNSVDPKTRRVAAHLLGCSEALADLTTAIMAAPRGATQPVADIAELSDEDPIEASIRTVTMGRERVKAVWVLLTELGVSPGGDMPANNAKAGAALVRSLQGLDESMTRDLEAVTALLRRA